MKVLRPESSAKTIRASRLYSPSISRNENRPGLSSGRICGFKEHDGSFIESMYAKRTCPTCFAKSFARDPAFCVLTPIAVCCVVCHEEQF
ncbi:hypothetical protein M404DRAFT_293101 [Pisolithus tinctorius Marx 270]|uniref:Uncharacterized protein n=1 Tax=Pisolithus tinctorius Marx 270 TaxID=870435 RepID=A0A0C3NJV2_PISTI|nr:hypothetical protein M404DRAFT_293101 [Pisolithus tinctorius Marx 270]